MCLHYRPSTITLWLVTDHKSNKTRASIKWWIVKKELYYSLSFMVIVSPQFIRFILRSFSFKNFILCHHTCMLHIHISITWCSSIVSSSKDFLVKLRKRLDGEGKLEGKLFGEFYYNFRSISTFNNCENNDEHK